jgi:hypothetical protein
MTKAKLEGEIKQLEKELKDPGLPDDIRDVLEGALDTAKDMLKNGRYDGGSNPPSKQEKAAVEKSVKKIAKKAGLSPAKKTSKKELSPLENCKEILAKYKREKETGKKRIAERKKAGKPAELTVKETLKKTAKIIENKVEKTEEDGKKFNTDAAVSGIRDILESVFSNTEKGERNTFLKELMQMMKEIGKKYGYKVDKYALGGTTGDGSGRFRYIIDLNERGSFRAHVEDKEGNDVFTILAGNELGEDETSIFDEGYMKNINDVGGLEDYLKQLNIMGQDDKLVGQYWEGDIDTPGAGEEKPVGKNMRIFSYRTSNFDVCPEAEEMFNDFMEHAGSDAIRSYIMAVARELDAFLGIVKKGRESESVDGQIIVNATGHVMKAMYMLFPAITKMIGFDGDPSKYYPRFVGPYMAELAGFDYRKANGGRIKSAINRDRTYESDQEHELNYKRKTSPKHPRYNKAKGGEVKFNDKVKAITKNLTGKKVPKKYQKEAGKVYNATEAKAAAQRIAGSMEQKKGKPTKKLFGGLINVESIDNLSAHSGDAWFYN